MRAWYLGAVVCVFALGGCSDARVPETLSAPAAAATEPLVPAPAGPAPFALQVDGIDLQPIGNGELLGVSAATPDEAAAFQAVEAARVTLEDYLDNQFVLPATRFGASALDQLLAPQAAALLDDEARRALGVLDLPVTATTAGPATAHAAVRLDGNAVMSVTLTYEARVSAVLGGAAGEALVQRGTVVLVPTAAGWRAIAADVTLEGPP